MTASNAVVGGDERVGSPIVRVRDLSGASGVTYTILEGDPDSLFRIDTDR